MPDWVSKRNLDIRSILLPAAVTQMGNMKSAASFLISLLSVLGQTYAAATRNPVKTLGQD